MKIPEIAKFRGGKHREKLVLKISQFSQKAKIFSGSSNEIYGIVGMRDNELRIEVLDCLG